MENQTGSTPTNEAPQSETVVESPSTPSVSTKPLSRSQQIDQLVKSMSDMPAPGEAAQAEGQTEAPQTEGETAPAKEKTAAEARKEFLAASKAARKAQEEQKKARELAQKADQISKFRADWQKSPSAVIQEMLGVDPAKFYQAQTDEFLGTHTAEPDPVVEKVQAELKPYIEELKKEKEAIQQQQITASEQHNIATRVLPVVKNAEQFPILLTVFETPEKAAAEIYQQVKNHWIKTSEFDAQGNVVKQGELVPFEECARQLEEFHEKQIDLGIKKIINMKKFAHYFRSEQASTGSTDTVAQPEQPKANKTLTNAHSPSVASPSVSKKPFTKMNLNDRIDEVLRSNNLKK